VKDKIVASFKGKVDMENIRELADKQSDNELLKNAHLLRCSVNRTAQRILIYASRYGSCAPCI